MHYYSYKLDEVLKMEARTYDYLCQCMIKAKANDDLELLELISYPHLKDNQNRNKVKQAIVRRAETQEQLEETVITTDQLQINGVSIGNIEDHIKGK